jgi:hypothetical protein
MQQERRCKIKTADEAIEFVREHGVVLEAARGPVPSLVEAIVGASVRGSWWGHHRAPEIFQLTRAIRSSPDVLVCRLVDRKITYVHRRLWPALARLADDVGTDRLAAVRDVHTAEGKHKVETTPFARWLADDVRRVAEQLTRAEAAAQMGSWLTQREM